MEIKGRITARPASESGTSAKGPWKKAFVVVRYEEGQYPKDVLLFNMKNADRFEQLSVGAYGTFKFDAKTRQSTNGRWYCELECWSWTTDQQQQTQRYGSYPDDRPL